MKLAWKFAIPQICIIVCLGLISFFVTNSSFADKREQYIRDTIENRFNNITRGIKAGAQESVKQTSVFLRLPVVTQAYEMALSGNIDDPYSLQVQAARELLRKELASMLDSCSETMG